MKICTICNQTYTNDDLNYCLADGGLLTNMTDDPPPTIMMGQARKTDQTNWGNQPGWADPNDQTKNQSNWGNQPNWGNQSQSSPITPWQNQQMGQNPSFLQPPMYQTQNQVLPIVSMVLGIISIVFCCYGSPFGIAAAITGYIGMNNANNQPAIYGGRGFAIAGLVLGIVNLFITIIFVLLAILGNLK